MILLSATRESDPLSTVLLVLGLRARFLTRADMKEGGSQRTDVTPGGFALHVCLAGRCTVRTENGEEHTLNLDELAMVPTRTHTVRADVDATIVSGECAFDVAAEHPLIAGLERIAVVSAHAIATFGWMRDTVELLDLETRNRSPGALVIADRAFEVLFIQALRTLGDRRTGEMQSTGFMFALADPVLRQVLEAMHAQPAEHWTVEKLAEGVSLSRSALTERFTNIVGVPPMQYLIEWRMQLARSMLVSTQCSVADIAKRAGYDSAAGFRRRFKARQGVAPTQFRKRGPNATRHS
jgi:AraC-like DNA-binding protein